MSDLFPDSDAPPDDAGYLDAAVPGGGASTGATGPGPGAAGAVAEGETVQVLGSLLAITFRNDENGYTVARLEVERREQPLTVVGLMPGVELGDSLAITGRWRSHPAYGRQLDVLRCELRLPTGRAGLVKYLGGGRIHGVGPKTAEKIVDALGTDLLARLEANPALLTTVPGLTRGKAAAIAAQLREQRASAAALAFLQEHGLGPAQAQRVWRRYGERTQQIVRENPWRLAEDVRGVGFRTADQLARSLGHAPDSEARIAAGLAHLLAGAAQEGHVGVPRELLLERAAPFLEVDEDRAAAVLGRCLQDGRCVEDGLVYRPELLAAERAIARHVRRLVGAGEPLVSVAADSAIAFSERRNRIELAPDQRRALAIALGARVAVITGGPGVGKTTIVRCLLDVLLAQGCRVALAAPTGRAARRLAEATGADASTLHRLLGITPSGTPVRRPGGVAGATGGSAAGSTASADGGDGAASGDGGNGGGGDAVESLAERVLGEPLAVDVLIVDEMSMVDVPLMAVVLAALPDGAGLLLVGDVDQLPSVGPGEVLRALIDSGVVPVARLATIFRQGEHSGIVRVAHQLDAGEAPEFDEGPSGQAFFVERDNPAAVLDALRAMVVERIPRRFGLDALRDVQVLTPVHAGPLGTVALNDALRAALNPPAPDRAELTRFGRLFRTGDKVMQVRNNYDLGVFNGDIGRLVALDDDSGEAVVDFGDRRVEYALDSLDQLEPAFAITCHKSQGSEFPAIVMPLVTSHFMMLRRNLVYTAFTRARSVLVVVGQLRALQMAAATTGSGQRHSRLAERLRDGA